MSWQLRVSTDFIEDPFEVDDDTWAAATRIALDHARAAWGEGTQHARVVGRGLLVSVVWDYQAKWYSVADLAVLDDDALHVIEDGLLGRATDWDDDAEGT